MPTISNFDKVHILYTDDNGATHAISQRQAVQTAAGNVVTTDDSLPGRPAKWKLRHVMVRYYSGTKTYRKKIVIGSVSNGLWSGATATVSIDGVTWTRQGRIGEARNVS